MSPKDRLIAAFKFMQPTDYVPTWELEFHLFKELVGKEPILGYEFEKLSYKEKEAATYHNAEIIAETAEICDHSAVTIMGGYWEQAPGEPAYYWIKDLEWRLKTIAILKDFFQGKRMIASYSDSCICMPSGNDMLDFVYRMSDDPESIIELNEKILKKGIDEGLRMIEAGADILCNACDIAFNSGTFFTPEQLDEFIYPYFVGWNEVFRKTGVYTVLHTDGNVDKILDEIVSCGFNALQCIDPIAGMNIMDVKSRVHDKISLIGNMNVSVMQLGSMDEIEAEARMILEGCKQGGGFVFGCCNVVFKGIPVENYRQLMKFRDQYGSY